MLYGIDLTLQYDTSEEEEETAWEIDISDCETLDKVEDFELDHDYPETTALLNKWVEDYLFNNPNPTCDELKEYIDKLNDFDDENWMKAIAYEIEYGYKSLADIIDTAGCTSIGIIEGYSDANRYIMEEAIGDGDISESLAGFVDWESYGNYIGADYQTATMGNTCFLYYIY